MVGVFQCLDGGAGGCGPFDSAIAGEHIETAFAERGGAAPDGDLQADGAEAAAASTQAVVTGYAGVDTESREGPGPVGDHEGGALAAGAGGEDTGTGKWDGYAVQAEDYQVQAVQQDRGHLQGIGAGIGDNRQTTQLRTHFGSGQ